MFSASLKGWRRAEVTEERTKLDFAHQIKNLLLLTFQKQKKLFLLYLHIEILRKVSF